MQISFRGESLLSDSRHSILLKKCQELVSDLTEIKTEQRFFVLLGKQPSQKDLVMLKDILAVQETAPILKDNQVAICPRKGTISPWASKTLDILKNCGLDFIERIERGYVYTFLAKPTITPQQIDIISPILYDRMTESPTRLLEDFFSQSIARPLEYINLLKEGLPALVRANTEMGLALTQEEMQYFSDVYSQIKRDPTDVELMMFSVVNSEHCRHKIFNAEWVVDGLRKTNSLFDMIRNTHKKQPQGTIKAYSDNSGILKGFSIPSFRPSMKNENRYQYQEGKTHILIKVETHNHPTAISPYSGASTGVGGEIRDEGAAGTGGTPQAGLCAFLTSHLQIPNFHQPWEKQRTAFPNRLASPLQIMTEGPIGGAAFGNEFGRPNIYGIFRTFEEHVLGECRGYHKPIMIAGGVGLIDETQVEKKKAATGDYVIQLGGPSMLIGLGGGAASSMDTGSNKEDLDFASVQRDNPELERRCQELINRCTSLGQENPIISIHDVGAGGLSNACPELVEDVGAHFKIRSILNDEPSMSPMQIWCNEAQERYVIVVKRDDLTRFHQIAQRERCLYAIIGEITGDKKITLSDELLEKDPIPEIDLGVFLGKPPRMLRDVKSLENKYTEENISDINISEAINRVLRFPAVAAKTFLITIADRSVTGLVARDQLVGPYQVPVSDVGLTMHSFKTNTGSAMAMGERTPVAVINAPASGRLAVAEAITNISSAFIGSIEDIKLSGNWMCACGEEGEDANLFKTVQSIGMEFCPELGVSIPVGKDSLSMRTVWDDGQGKNHKIVAPMSLVISAFSPVQDARKHVTPQLNPAPDTELILIDMGHGKNRLGASSLLQTYNRIGKITPDIDPKPLRQLFEVIQELHSQNLILAYHDRSDGGLFVTIAEMAFAGRCGIDLDISDLGEDSISALFNEEIGVVIQYHADKKQKIRTILNSYNLSGCSYTIGRPNTTKELTVSSNSNEIYRSKVQYLQSIWSEVSYHMQALRDNPVCAQQEFDAIQDTDDPGLQFKWSNVIQPSMINKGLKPQVAILREQGVNGHFEMAAAFDTAGFQSVDVTMTDLIKNITDLSKFSGLVSCGGFSYGDVLGAGAGWARSILFNPILKQQFKSFFERKDSFTLGVCNGCQMLSHLKMLIPGTEHWPHFSPNQSEQFEARLSTVEIIESNSILLNDMEGARLPIAVAHGEGRAVLNRNELKTLTQNKQISLMYVDNKGESTERYPANPNGSTSGATGFCSTDGTVTIMMPHPERVFRTSQLSYISNNLTDELTPWIQLFSNALKFVT